MTEFTGKVTIRTADERDAALIAVLGAVTFYEAYFEQDDPPDLAEYILESFAAEKIRAELEDTDSTFFIVYADGKSVGYAKLRENSKGAGVAVENAVELQRIYIVERVFGRGVGEKLLAHCLETARAKNFETLWLSVWEENRRAQKFYEKHGFRRVGTVKFPYGKTIGTNFIMEKNL